MIYIFVLWPIILKDHFSQKFIKISKNRSIGFIFPGQYVVFDSNTNTIKHKDCPPERFQPVERKSNAAMAFQCEKRMTSCDLTGEIKCDNGTSYTDRTCRCNFKEGYSLEAVAEDNSDKISCINPLHVILSCIQLDSCAKSQELNKYYTCVDKCPAGFYRPDGDGCHKVPDFVLVVEKINIINK